MLEIQRPAKAGRARTHRKEGKSHQSRTPPARKLWKEVEVEKRAEEGPMRNTTSKNHRMTKKVLRLKPRWETYGRGVARTPQEERTHLGERTKTGGGKMKKQKASNTETSKGMRRTREQEGAQKT